MSNPVIQWASDNPLMAGVAAVGVVVVAMMMFGGGGSDEGASNGAAAGAYYNAVAQQNAAGAAVQMAQITTAAQTNQTLIAASYGLENNKVWAENAAKTSLAKSQVEQTRAENERKKIELDSSDWVNETSTLTNAMNQFLATGNNQAAGDLLVAYYSGGTPRRA